jgi:hypothetical protein
MKKEEESKLTIVKDDKEEEKKINKPTDKEKEQYKDEFNAALKVFDKKKWQISEPGKFGANDVGLYILEFMNKYAHWAKTEWMGMIKMEEELKKAISAADENTGLQLGYQALEFCAYMLSNPGGTGLILAKEFESQADKYSKIGIIIGTKIEEARGELKNIQYLQDKWSAAEQGFYLADLEPKKDTTDEIKDDQDDIKLKGKTIEMDVTKAEIK